MICILWLNHWLHNYEICSLVKNIGLITIKYALSLEHRLQPYKICFIVINVSFTIIKYALLLQTLAS
jgi:hypothetical protein